MKKSVTLISWLMLIASFPVTQAAMAQGDAAAGQSKVALCASCHGADGNSVMPENPSLAGQNAKYLVKQIQDFKSGARNNITMTAMVGSLSDQDIADIAAFYASQQINVVGANTDALELGETLYRAGNPEISVAACTACHSPTGQGNAPAGFPAVGGQHASYTLAQLKAFRSGDRNNDDNAVMRTIVERLTDKELDALSNYLAGLN